MKVLDLRTLPCPQPVIQCRKVITEENISNLQIFVDNEAAVENVTRYLEQQGFNVQSTNKDNDFCINASKDGSALPSENIVVTKDTDDENILIFITTETLGRGDDELGHKLMATFLSTLPELGPSLWRIILLNGGVKLAALAGNSLESLKKIEKAGVKIMVCGTCLAHYELTEQKQVGETSNMLDIVTSLELADKVIRP